MSGNQPPMNTYNRSGQLMGYDVDLARAQALHAVIVVITGRDHEERCVHRDRPGGVGRIHVALLLSLVPILLRPHLVCAIH